MSPIDTFDDVLDMAIDAVADGARVDDVIARNLRHADVLRPLLEVAEQTARESAVMAPPRSRALVHNYAIVRAAVERAQMAAAAVPVARQPEPAGHWFQRRLRFASLTLPAGVFAAIAFAGISGAAAASVAATGHADLPAVVGDLLSPHVLMGSDGSGEEGSHGAAADARGGQGGNANGLVADATRGPEFVVQSGTISELRGNVFTLTTADGVTHVNIDANTSVTGEIADGASATVSGDLTDDKNLHATKVEITAPGIAAPTPGNPFVSGPDDHTAGPPADHTPGAPVDATPSPSTDHTPAPPADHTPTPPDDHTPGPPAERTPGPQGDHTPPGGGGENNGNADDNGGGSRPTKTP